MDLRSQPATRCVASRDARAARQRAQQLGLEGAAFPWRTIGGEECSRTRWRYGCLPRQRRHRRRRRPLPVHHPRQGVRGRAGLHLLVEHARLWRSLGHHRIWRVPYRMRALPAPTRIAVVDDNIDHLAEQNLRDGGRGRRPQRRAGATGSASTRRSWPPGATAPPRCTSRTTDGSHVHPQDAKFTHHDSAHVHGSGVPAADGYAAVLPALPQAGLASWRTS